MHTRIVELNSLNIGVKLYALKSEADYFIDVRRHILAVGMKRSESCKTSVALGNSLRDKIIYAGHLMGRSSDRLHHEMLYSRALAVLEKR